MKTLKFSLSMLAVCLLLVPTAKGDDLTDAAAALALANAKPQPAPKQPCAICGLACTCSPCDCGLKPHGAVGQPRPTYAEQYAASLTSGKPLVVGVGCEPPVGTWLTVRVETLEGFAGPCVVVSSPQGDCLAWRKTLASGATTATVKDCLTIPVAAQTTSPPQQTYYTPLYQQGYAYGSVYSGGGCAGSSCGGSMMMGGFRVTGGCASGKCR